MAHLRKCRFGGVGEQTIESPAFATVSKDAENGVHEPHEGSATAWALAKTLEH